MMVLWKRGVPAKNVRLWKPCMTILISVFASEAGCRIPFVFPLEYDRVRIVSYCSTSTLSLREAMDNIEGLST